MNEIKNDINLREAINRKEQKLPQMPSDLNKRLLNKLTDSSSQPRHITLLSKVWWMAAAAVLVAVLALFTWKSQTSKTQPQMAKQENAPKVIEKDNVPNEPTSHVMIANITRYDDQLDEPSLETPQPKKKNRKAVKPQEPMIAEAEPMPEEPETEQEYLPTEEDPFLLAAAFSQDIRSRGEHLYQEVAQMINNQ